MKEVADRRTGVPNRRTILHWIVVFALGVSGLLTSLTGVLLLFLSSGGYQGGRNLSYGVTFLLDRPTWIDLHMWAGIVMVVVCLVHIALHRQWMVEMGRRTLAVIRRKRKPFNRKIWARVGVIAAVGLLFVGVAASGVYFFLVPGGQGASKTVQFLLSRSTWDSIHTWTGVFMIVGGAVHLSMRWKWVARVTPAVTGAVTSRLSISGTRARSAAYNQ